MKKILGVLLFIMFSGIILATPDDGVNEHETLIGYNNESYFCVQFIRYPTGTYYASRDSAFIVERDFRTAKIKSRLFISSRRHYDKTTMGDWHSEIYENENFDLIDFVSKNGIKYLYPNIYRFGTYDILRFNMDLEGLKVSVNFKFELISDPSKFEKTAPWIKEYLFKQKERNENYPNLKPAEFITVHNSNGDEKYIFITVSGKYEPESRQIVYAFERETFELLIDKYKKQQE